MKKLRACDGDSYLFFGLGTASPASGQVEEVRPLRATLWLPNPEAAHGWAVYPVFAEQESPTERPIGFQRGQRP